MADAPPFSIVLAPISSCHFSTLKKYDNDDTVYKAAPGKNQTTTICLRCAIVAPKKVPFEGNFE